MKTDEAAAVVRGMIASLRDEPDQFHISINVTGQSVTSYGGTGLSIKAVGGGPGSSTIGQKVTASTGDIEIARTRGAQALDQQHSALLDSLDAIAAQLEAKTPDIGKIRGLYNSLVGTWVPGVVTSVLASVLMQTVGL